MNCFAHQSSAAVGICKSCGKGLCSRCAADTGEGLACRDSCEERVLLLGRMVANNAKVMKTANRQTRSMAMFGVCTGALFMAAGAYFYDDRNPFVTLFVGGLGLIMFFHALLRLLTERFPSPEK